MHHYAENPFRTGANPKDSAAASEIDSERVPTDTRRRSAEAAHKPRRTIEFDDPAEVKGRKGKAEEDGTAGAFELQKTGAPV